MTTTLYASEHREAVIKNVLSEAEGYSMIIFRFNDYKNVIIQIWERDSDTKFKFFTETCLYDTEEQVAAEARYCLGFVGDGKDQRGYYDFGAGELVNLTAMTPIFKRVAQEAEPFKFVKERDIDDFVEQHLNVMIGAMQNDMNQYDGGLASVYFSGDNWDTLKRIMADYVRYENSVAADQ